MGRSRDRDKDEMGWSWAKSKLSASVNQAIVAGSAFIETKSDVTSRDMDMCESGGGPAVAGEKKGASIGRIEL
jgi:hypothetical protein